MCVLVLVHTAQTICVQCGIWSWQHTFDNSVSTTKRGCFHRNRIQLVHDSMWKRILILCGTWLNSAPIPLPLFNGNLWKLVFPEHVYFLGELFAVSTRLKSSAFVTPVIVPLHCLRQTMKTPMNCQHQHWQINQLFWHVFLAHLFILSVCL